MKLCSFDARSEVQPGRSLLRGRVQARKEHFEIHSWSVNQRPSHALTDLPEMLPGIFIWHQSKPGKSDEEMVGIVGHSFQTSNAE